MNLNLGIMNKLNILGFLKGLLLKIFPFLGYKGVVSQQIRIYKKFKREDYPEDAILNIILDARKKFSSRDVGADSYYQDLMTMQDKTLESVIMAIVEWEYLSNMRAYEIRGKHNIPSEFIESSRNEMSRYIHEKVSDI